MRIGTSVFLKSLLVLFITALACLAASDWTFDIRDYGAVADGKTDCTQAIQNAVDTCGKRGGEMVVIPPGRSSEKRKKLLDQRRPCRYSGSHTTSLSYMV